MTSQAVVNVKAGVSQGRQMRIVAGCAVKLHLASGKFCDILLPFETGALRHSDGSKSNQEPIGWNQLVSRHLVGPTMTLPAAVD